MFPIEKFLAETPRVPLVPGPTPIHKLQWTPADDTVSMFVKRDDLTGIGTGGNKIRSLEYILGEAVSLGFNKVLVSGPEQSNLCMLTAAACARIGMPCELIYNCKRPSIMQGNLMLINLLGVTTHFIGECTEEIRGQFAEKLAAQYKLNGELPYLISNGAATGRGALGYAAAAAEMAAQCSEMGIDRMTVFVPGGNGGVAGGLIYGNALIGEPLNVVVVSVEHPKHILFKKIIQIIEEAEQITGLPIDPIQKQSIVITDAYRGDGWAKNTAESTEEIFSFSKTEGFFIENVYNSKTVVCMKDWVEKGNVRGCVCYLHTGGLGSLFAQC